MPGPDGPTRWQLYDLSADQGESHDLSDVFPEKKTELMAFWDRYMEETGVVQLQR